MNWRMAHRACGIVKWVALLLLLIVVACSEGESDQMAPAMSFKENRYFAIIPTCLPNCTDAHKRKEYLNGKIRPVILDLIESAKESIDIGAFNFSILELYHALARKIEKDGIKVRILFPDMRLASGVTKDACLKRAMETSEYRNKRIIERGVFLKAKCPEAYSKLNLLEVMYLNMNDVRNVEVKAFNNKKGGLYHHKMMIVDNKRAIFGSGNFTYNGLAINLEEFTLLGEKEEELVKRFSCEFDSLFHDIGQSCGTRDIFFTPGRSDVKAVIEDNIRQSKNEIKIFVHQFGIDDIVRVLKKRSENGVRIRWIRSGEYCTDAELQKMKSLPSPSFEVRYFFGSKNISQFAHAKFALFDNLRAVFGSGNWTSPAFNANNEYYLDDTVRAEKRKSLDEMFETVWNKHSSSLEECRRRIKALSH